jgi:AcrR family transcriptional regulator
VSKSAKAESAKIGGRVRAPLPRPNADPATRQRVLDAAVSCIIELGFYRASSNAIARHADVTWGVIQYHFGTREALMLAVLEETSARFVNLVEHANIAGDDATGRINQLLDLLAGHYGTPEYLAFTQILLNMEHDPSTSADVRATLRTVAERSNEHVRRLLRQTLGRAEGDADLAATLFLALRGFVLSQQLLDTMAYESIPPNRGHTDRQRRLLSEMLAPYLEQLGA